LIQKTAFISSIFILQQHFAMSGKVISLVACSTSGKLFFKAKASGAGSAAHVSVLLLKVAIRKSLSPSSDIYHNYFHQNIQQDHQAGCQTTANPKNVNK
jgi:hypothetical protein